MLKIPTFARIGWNTFDDKTVQRDDQESIFLATFDDFSGEKYKFQIDYSYYNRGKYEAQPLFILEVYTCGDDVVETEHHFVKQYKTMDEAEGDINHWLQFFQEKVTHLILQKTIMKKVKKGKKPSTSTLSLHLTFKKETSQYVTDFFTTGIKHVHLPSVLYTYDFNFKNKPNFSGNTTMFCEKKKGRYYLSIYHKFDFETEAAEAYWFVGGLAQYAEDDDLAGYVKHTFENVQSQVFGFRNKMCYWQNEVSINFNWAKYINADLTFRDMEKHEISFLEDMLHQAIFTPEGSTPPEKSIIFEPFLHHYIADFGRENDVAMVAEVEGKLVGAAWSRLFSDEQKGYGFVDAETPELSIAIDFQHRNSGIGRILFYDFLQKLRKKGYKQVSLSVDMRNFAYALYKKSGFEVVETKENSAIMVFKF